MGNSLCCREENNNRNIDDHIKALNEEEDYLRSLLNKNPLGENKLIDR
jgi:hypothetical protein